MAFWQFKLIVTYIMTSLTLATRIENLTTDGYFIAKLLNPRRGIVRYSHTKFSWVPFGM